MNKSLQQFEPDNQVTSGCMRLTALVIGVSCFVLVAKAHGSAEHSLTLVDKTKATTTLTILNDATRDFVLSRSPRKTDSRFFALKKNVDKLQTFPNSLLTKTQLKLKKLKSDHELKLTKIESDLDSLNTTMQLKLSTLNRDVHELKVASGKLKKITLEFPLILDEHKIFDALDVDNDGKLSHQEFIDGTRLPEDNDKFDKMDVSDDGSLSFEEFNEGLKLKTSKSAPKHN